MSGATLTIRMEGKNIVLKDGKGSTSRFGTPLKATISHSEIEELFLLPEIFMWKDRSCNAGDYCRADSGMIHGETFTDSGCLFLLLASQQNELLSKQAF